MGGGHIAQRYCELAPGFFLNILYFWQLMAIKKVICSKYLVLGMEVVLIHQVVDVSDEQEVIIERLLKDAQMTHFCFLILRLSST